MKTKATIFALAITLGMVTAECPNACSGHGTCNQYDNCECFSDWIGGDCSERVCPYGLSFVSTPMGDLNHNGDVSVQDNVPVQWSNWKNQITVNERWNNKMNGEGHAYAECSGKGLCDRATGLCECFDGYTGAACQRTTCPNDCSGHGMCHTLGEIASGVPTHNYEPRKRGRNYRITKFEYGSAITAGVQDAFAYNIWDSDKNQACVCDAGYFGVDCSLRDCPRGADPLQLYQEQQCDAEIIKKQLIVFQVDDVLGIDSFTVRVGKLSSPDHVVGTVGGEFIADDMITAIEEGFTALNIPSTAYSLQDAGCFNASSGSSCPTGLTDGDTQVLSLEFSNPEYAASPVVLVVNSSSSAYTVESFFYQGGECVNGAEYRQDISTSALEPNFANTDCNSDICSCNTQGGFLDPVTDVTTSAVCAPAEKQVVYFENSGDGSGDTRLILEWLDDISTFNSYTGSRLRSEMVHIPATGTAQDISAALQKALASFPNGILNDISVTCYEVDVSSAPVLGSCPVGALNSLTNPLAFQLDFSTHARNGSPNPVVVYTVDQNEIPANPTNSMTVESFYIRKGMCHSTAEMRTYTAGAVQPEDGAKWQFSNACMQLGSVEGYDDNLPCSNRGLCEYSTGQCKCFAGYTHEDCSIQSALAM